MVMMTQPPTRLKTWFLHSWEEPDCRGGYGSLHLIEARDAASALNKARILIRRTSLELTISLYDDSDRLIKEGLRREWFSK